MPEPSVHLRRRTPRNKWFKKMTSTQCERIMLFQILDTSDDAVLGLLLGAKPPSDVGHLLGDVIFPLSPGRIIQLRR